MNDAAILAAIFIAIGIGFVLGRYPNVLLFRFKSRSSPELTRRFQEGLAFLLKDEPDEAIDRFIADMEITEETLEIHLSLGALLRRKGEFQRAIKVHENLISSAVVHGHASHMVTYELASDYFESGIFDRAESLLRELNDSAAIERSLRTMAARDLCDIYQQTHEWLLAVDMADQLTQAKFSEDADEWREAQSHFCCELAILAQDKEDEQEVRRWLVAALRYDRRCVRASMMLAEMDIAVEAYHAALATLKAIPSQNPVFASEMVQPLVRCYQKLESEKDAIQVLHEYLSSHKDYSALKCLFGLSKAHEGLRAALRRVESVLGVYDDMPGVQQLLSVLQRQGDVAYLEQFEEALVQMLEKDKGYECHKCGFTGNCIQWFCPSCHAWGSIRLQK